MIIIWCEIHASEYANPFQWNFHIETAIMIETIHIKKYKMLRDITIKDLSKMCVFLGANGTDKSTFFDVLTFLKDALAQNV